MFSLVHCQKTLVRVRWSWQLEHVGALASLSKAVSVSTRIHKDSLYCYRKAQEENKKIVLAGCVPQAQPRQDYLKGLSIIGVSVDLMGN